MKSLSTGTKHHAVSKAPFREEAANVAASCKVPRMGRQHSTEATGGHTGKKGRLPYIIIYFILFYFIQITLYHIILYSTVFYYILFYYIILALLKQSSAERLQG